MDESPARASTNSIAHTPDDDDLEDENLDLFLSLIESRLRADFTSTDLTRLIATQGVASRGGGAGAATSALPSGNASSPSKFLRLVCKVFHRAAKPVKLRTLLSVLGLESDKMIDAASAAPSRLQYEEQSLDVEEKKTDKIIWKLLDQAEQDDEKWVRVVGGILRGIMFKSSASNELGSEVEDVNYYSDPACRGKTAERELRKVSEGILNGVKEAYSAGQRELSRAEASCDASDAKQKARLDSLLIGKDACPTFAPYRYSLLPPETIKKIMPEVDVNHHFSANMNASIFKVDAEVEEKRAEEEGKELQLQKQRNGTVNSTTAGRGSVGPGASSTVPGRVDPALAGRFRGRFTNAGGRGGDRGTSSFLVTSTGRGVPAGRSLTGRAGGRSGVTGRSMAGRSGSLGRLGAGRLGTEGRAGGVGVAGRGRAAGLVGQTPLQRRVPGSTRAMLNSSASAGASSKMKMIDTSEVEGLNRAQKEREREAGMTKAERRRKLLEDAAASGLRNKKARTDAPAASTVNNDHNQASEMETEPIHSHAPFQQNDFGSLLEKSNKLSDEDRRNIYEFFQNQASINPHPSSEGDGSHDQWKVKLNEERTIDPASGENVKETLYLELDYGTRRYKLSKKIKRK